MLVLRSLHNYLSQILSPPAIHTALLITPEGALVSYACRTENENEGTTPTIAPVELAGDGLSPNSTESETIEPRSHSPNSAVSQMLAALHGQGGQVRSKDEIRIVAGLSAEVWAETRVTEGEEATVESELGRILVVAVEAPSEDTEAPPTEEPLLLLALNGTADAQWEAMSTKARKLVAFLAPAVNKYRGQMQPVSATLGPGNSGGGGAKSRTRSAATSPGRVAR